MTTTTQDKEIANLILMDFDPDEIAGEVSDLISKKINQKPLPHQTKLMILLFPPAQTPHQAKT